MSQALRNRRSLGASRQSHSSARPQPITSISQQARLDPDDDADRLQREQEARRRRQKRRLEELERTNYRDGPSGLTFPDEAGSGSSVSLVGALAGSREGDRPEPAARASATAANSPASRKKASAEVKRILSTRKRFATLLEEAAETPGFHNAPNYLSAAAGPPRYPRPALCSICGYWGTVTCLRCGDKYCGLVCKGTHDETRCDRPIR
ncbi:hypothetical protein ACQY0O_000550 [Thecaphora frezii]